MGHPELLASYFRGLEPPAPCVLAGFWGVLVAEDAAEDFAGVVHGEAAGGDDPDVAGGFVGG